MSLLRVAPIVEGHGEYESIRILLTRIWGELLQGEFIDVIRPIRRPRSKLVQAGELARAVELACRKLSQENEPPAPSLVLILIDADEDPPCVLAPRLLADATAARSDVDISVVLPNREYETWFVASASGLEKFLHVDSETELPERPEDARMGKGWIDKHFRGTKYSETVDQPSMTSEIDLATCRERCPSFDKLCRELEARLQPRDDRSEE